MPCPPLRYGQVSGKSHVSFLYPNPKPVTKLCLKWHNLSLLYIWRGFCLGVSSTLKKNTLKDEPPILTRKEHLKIGYAHGFSTTLPHSPVV